MQKHDVILVFIFSLMMVIGLCFGSLDAVREKAITICLECIGIG